MRSIILVLHICTGTVGMLSGFVAMAFRKGSQRHSLAGDVFAVSMLILSASGIWLAATKSQTGNVLGGTFTFYMVATAWMAGERGEVKTGILDWIGLLAVCSLAAIEWTYGIEAMLSPTGLKYDYPPWPFLLFGTLAVLAAVGDVRMLARHGISGKPRILRHIWRMCFAWFIASMSIFLARQERFPEAFRKTGVLVVLTFLPLALMIFWLVRVRFTKWASASRGNRERRTIAQQAAGGGGLVAAENL
jgi:uncharacterized membrane protein